MHGLQFVHIFEIYIIFCFVIAICDLVHDVETIFHLSYALAASGNLFRNMTDASETANCSFTEFAVSQGSLIFQKRFPDAVNT